MAKTKKKTKVKAKSGKDKVKEYFDSIDFRTWWESFNGDCEKNGMRKYRTVWQFVIKKTKIQWQRDFLWWILGAKGESTEYSEYAQFDWETKRENGFWHSSKNIEELGKAVKNKASALGAMKEIGQINLSLIGSYLELSKELNREYAGRLFLAELSDKENEARVNTYMKLQDRLLSMQERVQVLFSKTQGLDIDQLPAFFAMFNNAPQGASLASSLGITEVDHSRTIEGSSDKASDTMGKVTKMLMTKVADRGLAMPEDVEDVIIESNRPVLIPKKKVN